MGTQLNKTHFLPTAFVKSFIVSVLPVPVAPNAIELTPSLNASMILLLFYVACHLISKHKRDSIKKVGNLIKYEMIMLVLVMVQI